MIQTNGLTKVFRTDEMETTALNNLDISIREGEFVSIMGPSGCGKSTLLNVLGLLDSPTGGDYLFAGDKVSGMTEGQRADYRKDNIGFVFQSFNLIDELTVFENVELPLYYQKVPKLERQERVNNILAKMGIEHRAKHFPQQLSGGQQQRVAVSRAVVTNPKVIFADEPTGNLDSAHGNEVMTMLSELHKAGTTIVMVTHSPAFAEWGDRTINLLDGSIIAVAENGKATA